MASGSSSPTPYFGTSVALHGCKDGIQGCSASPAALCGSGCGVEGARGTGHHSEPP